MSGDGYLDAGIGHHPDSVQELLQHSKSRLISSRTSNDPARSTAVAATPVPA